VRTQTRLKIATRDRGRRRRLLFRAIGIWSPARLSTAPAPACLPLVARPLTTRAPAPALTCHRLPQPRPQLLAMVTGHHNAEARPLTAPARTPEPATAHWTAQEQAPYSDRPYLSKFVLGSVCSRPRSGSTAGGWPVDPIAGAKIVTSRPSPRSQPVGLTAGGPDLGLWQPDLEKSFAMIIRAYLDQDRSRTSTYCENHKNVLP
jgi:hypothetical protein